MEGQKDNYKKFIIYMLQNLRKLTLFQNTPEQRATVTFLRKMRSSAEAVLELNANNLNYEASIIASHMGEGFLLLSWLLDDTTRITKYEDYIFIEFLPSSDVVLLDREELLKKIEQKNVRRFLKKNNETLSDNELLNRKNYYNCWYKPEINTLNNISENVKNNSLQKVTKEVYDMYNILCAYKHYSPSVMPDPHDISNRWETRSSRIALKATILCLYYTLIYTSNFQELAIEDIIYRYNQVFT